jgi:hypothetical protein
MGATWKVPLPNALISVLECGPGGSRRRRGAAGGSRGVRLALQRGLGEAVYRSQAWLVTGGRAEDAGTRAAGLAARYARRDLHMDDGPTCVGVVDLDALRHRQAILQTRNGRVLKYDEAATSSAGASEAAGGGGGGGELEPFHTHFLLTDGRGASRFRARFEKRISSFDISGDGVRTPQVVVVVGGGPSAFERVAMLLEQGVPVLVVRETGGAALDIYKYILGVDSEGGVEWPDPNEPDEQAAARPMPVCVEDDDAEYVDAAHEWLPRILEHGNRTGSNTSRQLALYSLENEQSAEQSLATAIQRCAMFFSRGG